VVRQRKLRAVEGRIGKHGRQRATLENSRSRETRLALIRAASQLWGEGNFNEAFDATTTGDIAEAAGVSKGTFYFHFANKEAIVIEMGSTTIQAMIDYIHIGSQRGVSLDSLADQTMKLMARRIASGPRAAASRAAALGNMTEVAGASPRLDAAFEGLLRYGKERHELGPHIDVEDAAAMMTVVTMDAIKHWGQGDQPTQWLARTLQHRVAVILRGIEQSPSRSSLRDA
jgi:AcrR family transcriptional regulator